jgi:hypothetical protein
MPSVESIPGYSPTPHTVVPGMHPRSVPAQRVATGYKPKGKPKANPSSVDGGFYDADFATPSVPQTAYNNVVQKPFNKLQRAGSALDNFLHDLGFRAPNPRSGFTPNDSLGKTQIVDFIGNNTSKKGNTVAGSYKPMVARPVSTQQQYMGGNIGQGQYSLGGDGKFGGSGAESWMAGEKGGDNSDFGQMAAMQQQDGGVSPQFGSQNGQGVLGALPPGPNMQASPAGSPMAPGPVGGGMQPFGRPHGATAATPFTVDDKPRPRFAIAGTGRRGHRTTPGPYDSSVYEKLLSTLGA